MKIFPQLKVFHGKIVTGYPHVRFFHFSRQRCLHSTYSQDEQEKILKFINQFSPAQITRLKLPSSFKKVMEFRNKHGPITSINELLEVKGISTKPALSLCNTILKRLEDCHNHSDEGSSRPTEINKWERKNPSQNKLSKQLQPMLVKCPGKFAAISIAAHSISWVVMEKKETWKNQTLLHWNFYNFSSEPLRKINLVHEILSLENVIPKEDVYVIRNQNSGKQKSSPMIDQMFGIVLSLLCSKQCFSADAEQNIFLMKAGVPGRMFNLMVGSETISVQNLVNIILNGVDHDQVDANDTFPELRDSLRQIEFAEKCAMFYRDQDSFHKEILLKPLLLAKAFATIILESFPESK